MNDENTIFVNFKLTLRELKYHYYNRDAQGWCTCSVSYSTNMLIFDFPPATAKHICSLFSKELLHTDLHKSTLTVNPTTNCYGFSTAGDFPLDFPEDLCEVDFPVDVEKLTNN